MNTRYKNETPHNLYKNMQKFVLPILFFTLMSLQGLQAKGAKEEQVQEPEAIVLSELIHYRVPEKAQQGDFISIYFTSELPNFTAWAKLSNAQNKIIAQSTAFCIKENILLALLPIAVNIPPGEYTITLTTSRNSLEQTTSYPISITKTSFISEEIALNSSNTSIKTDTSKERLEQIAKLNEILERINPDALVSTNNFASPLANEPVRRTSFFGDNRVYRYATGGTDTAYHYGIDYGVPIGTPVYAISDGRVVMAEKRISTGYTLVIEHFPGLYSLYYHLDRLLTTTGEQVRTGSLIAHSGNTGLSTGPHLHLEVRLNAIAINPDKLFNQNLTALDP